MTTDLSICQAALNRDPVLYLDMTESVRRGDGRVLAASPWGALVAFTNLMDGPDYGYTMFADDEPDAAVVAADEFQMAGEVQTIANEIQAADGEAEATEADFDPEI